MSHHPQGQKCVITVVLPDNAASRAAIKAIPIQGGWEDRPVTSANGKLVYGLWCSTLPDASLVLLKALTGVVVTENSDPAWATKSAFTKRASP